MTAAPQLAEELFNEHHRRIYAYCLRQLGSPEEAEDAVQATYLNACRSLMTGFEPDVAQAWLYKVAHNVCLTRRRSSYRRARLERPQDLQAVQDVAAAPESPGDELFGLEDALAGLPEQQRQAILLREWQGLSYREVAVKLGLTQSAVETLIFRARRSLASALERPAERRRRLLHSFAPGALATSIKSALAGNLSASVATAVAVAASATTLAATPVARTFDFPRHAPVVDSATPAKPTHRPHLSDRAAVPVADPVAATGKVLPSRAKAKRWAGDHPRAAGKAEGKGKGKSEAGHGNPPGPTRHPKLHVPASPRPSAQARPGGAGPAHAYGKGGKKS